MGWLQNSLKHVPIIPSSTGVHSMDICKAEKFKVASSAFRVQCWDRIQILQIVVIVCLLAISWAQCFGNKLLNEEFPVRNLSRVYKGHCALWGNSVLLSVQWVVAWHSSTICIKKRTDDRVWWSSVSLASMVVKLFFFFWWILNSPRD